MRKAIALGTAAAALAVMAVAAAPATADNTAVTFAITGGGLSMSIPSNPTVSLSGAGGLALGSASVTGALNPTTVSDARGGLLSSWKVQVTSTDFSSADTTIPKANGSMYIDVANVAGLAGMLTGGMVATSVATAVTPASLAAATPAATLLAGTTALTGSITYTPTLKVTIPENTPAGTYSGTVTQTAS